MRRMRVSVTEQVEAKEELRGRREGRREMLYWGDAVWEDDV